MVRPWLMSHWVMANLYIFKIMTVVNSQLPLIPLISPKYSTLLNLLQIYYLFINFVLTITVFLFFILTGSSYRIKSLAVLSILVKASMVSIIFPVLLLYPHLPCLPNLLIFISFWSSCSKNS